MGFPCTGVKGARSSAWRRGYSAVSGGTCGVAWGASRTVARPLATTGTLRGCILAFFPLTGVVLGVWWRVGEIGCRGLSFPFFEYFFNNSHGMLRCTVPNSKAE